MLWLPAPAPLPPLQNTQLKPHLPAWVLGLPIRKLWLSNNQLSALVPARGGNAARKEAWLARLTHVCLSSNALRDLPKGLLEHGKALEELDCAYNHQLQAGGASWAHGRGGAVTRGGGGAGPRGDGFRAGARVPRCGVQQHQPPLLASCLACCPQISAKAADVAAEMPWCVAPRCCTRQPRPAPQQLQQAAVPAPRHLPLCPMRLCHPAVRRGAPASDPLQPGPCPARSLRSLRLEKSYWLRLEDRWSQASLRAIRRLQERRPDVRIDYAHQALPGGLRTAW